MFARALPDRGEFEYTLASDERAHVAREKSRFDNPETIIVFEDTQSALTLLYDPEHNLEERILKEQFQP